MRRRILALFLVIIMVLSTIPVSASPEYPETLDELESALFSATPGSTITLGSDILIDRSLDISPYDVFINPDGILQDYGNYTINTNGYSLIVDGAIGSATLTVGSNVTITGNSSEIIKLPAGSVHNNTLEMHGTISSTCVSGPTDYTILAEDAKSFVNIYPGADIYTPNQHSSSIRATGGAEVNIAGGVITSGGRALSLSGFFTHANITDGSLEGGAQALYVEYGATATLDGGALNPFGGTGYAAYLYSGASVSFLNGVANGDDVGILVQDSTATIDMPITSVTDTVKITDGGTANIYNNITATSAVNPLAVNVINSTVNVYSGAIVATGGTGVSITGNSDCSFQGGSIAGNIGIRVNEDATLLMSGGIINASGISPVGVLVDSNTGLTGAVASIVAGTITVDATGSADPGTVIHTNGEASTADIQGGSFNLTGYADMATTYGAVFKATNDGFVQIKDSGSLNAPIQVNLDANHNSRVLLADGGTIAVDDALNAVTIAPTFGLIYADISAGGVINLFEVSPVLTGSKQIWVSSDETDFFGDNIAFLNTSADADVDIVLRKPGSKVTIGGETFTGVAYSYDVPRGATLGEVIGVLPSESISGPFRDITWAAASVDTSIPGQYPAYGNFLAYDMLGTNAQVSLRTEVIVGNYPALVGTALIYGDRIFGEALTVVIPDSNAPFDEFTYQWYRWNDGTSQWDAIDGATSGSYTLVAADVGTTHRVLIGASEKIGTLTGLSVENVVKAQNTLVPNAPTFISKTATEVIVGSGAYDYRFVGGEWQSTNAFSGLTPNTTYEFQVRFMETATKYASAPSAVLEVTTSSLPPLQGTVSIDGQFIYGQTLTAITTSITSTTPGTFSYQWFIVDPVTSDTFPIGMDSSTYTITASDVGKGIALAVGAANYSGSVTTGEAYLVAKAIGPTPVPIALTVGKRTIEFPYVENTFEYSLNGITWQDSKVFSGLIPNTEYTARARYKETHTHSASTIVDTLVTTLNLDTPAIPDAPTVLEKTATSISLVTIPGNVYIMNNGERMNTHGVFPFLNPNTEYSFKQRVESTDDSFESDWSDAALITTNPKAAQDAPSAPVLESKTYNSITLTDLGGAKVALRSIGGVIVADEDLVFGTLPVFEDLQPNTTYGFVTRLDATDSLLVSPLSTVTEITTDSLGVPSAPNAPTVATKTTTSITLLSVAGCEYKLGDGEWQEGTVFSGLIEGAEYTFYQRLRATPGFVVSETSAPLIARTVESALITAFSFNTLTPNVTGTVNEGAKTIALTVPYGTDVTTLVPTITHTGASVSPGNNVAQNFTSPVTYTVTAADATITTYTVTVTRNASSSGGSSSGNSSTPTSAPQPSQGAVIVIVNGEAQNAGTETRTTKNGTTTVTVEVDNRVIENKMEEAMASNPAGTGNYIQVPIADTSAQAVNVALTGDMVKKLEENRFDVSVKRDDVEYIIPAEEINIGKVAETLGVARTDLASIQVEVKMTRLDEGAIKKYNEVAMANGAELIFPPVSFSVVAKTTKADGSTAEVGINTFSNYVERVMELPAGMDPSQVTTGIVFNSDGTYSHVPTTVFQKDGKWYASLRSLTNSAYSVIWHPVTVASVANHWSRDAVNDMASRLVIKDPENFVPTQNISRGEFAEYITKALGLYRTGMAYTQTFSDVTGMPDLTAAIEIASAYGIIKGYPDGSFKPNAQISREEAMVMYARAMDVAGLEEVDNNRISQYMDMDMIASWAFHDVKKTVSAGVFNGKSKETINPKDTFSKAEAATAIRNLLVVSGLINQ